MVERFQVFTVLISKINRAIKKIKTEEMEEFNLKSPHVSCLYYLLKADSLTAKELGDICAEDKASLSRSLEHLESEGYIECDSNLKKKYKSALVLTDKGRFVAEKVAGKVDRILDIAGNGLTEEKRTVLYESLRLISDNLENLCNNYKGEK